MHIHHAHPIKCQASPRVGLIGHGRSFRRDRRPRDECLAEAGTDNPSTRRNHHPEGDVATGLAMHPLSVGMEEYGIAELVYSPL